MIDRRTATLLNDVLELQVEPAGDFDDLAFARLVNDWLERGGEPDPVILELVWRSPAAREIFFDLRHEAVAALQDRWTGRGFATDFERLAADQDTDEATFSAAGLALHMVLNRASGRWLVNLRLTPEAKRELPDGFSVRVADKGGKVWLEGLLDRHGGLDAFWEDDMTPGERARRFGLTFEIC